MWCLWNRIRTFRSGRRIRHRRSCRRGPTPHSTAGFDTDHKVGWRWALKETTDRHRINTDQFGPSILSQLRVPAALLNAVVVSPSAEGGEEVSVVADVRIGGVVRMLIRRNARVLHAGSVIDDMLKVAVANGGVCQSPSRKTIRELLTPCSRERSSHSAWHATFSRN